MSDPLPVIIIQLREVRQLHNNGNWVNLTSSGDLVSVRNNIGSESSTPGENPRVTSNGDADVLRSTLSPNTARYFGPLISRRAGVSHVVPVLLTGSYICYVVGRLYRE
jgi:hypothetical protein